MGFETTDETSLREQRKFQNLHRDYSEAVRRLHEHGVVVNGSFVFGMDGHDATVFDRTVDWAITNGVETSTFHILTPYPSTELHTRMQRERRILHNNWDLYDTRHCVYRPAKLTGAQIETGYWRAYQDFYRWGSILQGALTKEKWSGRLRHFAYAAGWKKFEPLWDFVIRAKRVARMLPLLETILEEFGHKSTESHPFDVPQEKKPSPDSELLTIS